MRGAEIQIEYNQRWIGPRLLQQILLRGDVFQLHPGMLGGFVNLRRKEQIAHYREHGWLVLHRSKSLEKLLDLNRFSFVCARRTGDTIEPCFAALRPA